MNLRHGVMTGAGALAALAMVAAAAAADLKAQLTERLAVKQSDPVTWQKWVAAGAERTEFCARCHGADGTSVQALVPNLAGQNPFYLLEQNERFADGRRTDFVMTPLAKRFSAEDKILLAIFYSAQAPKPGPTNAALVDAGRARYQANCVTCHGPRAHGDETFPRLAGQRMEYLRHRLFQLKQQPPTPNATPMVAMAKTLSDSDIDAVAAYLANLP
jgi:cytochrome c553